MRSLFTIGHRSRNGKPGVPKDPFQPDYPVSFTKVLLSNNSTTRHLCPRIRIRRQTQQQRRCRREHNDFLYSCPHESSSFTRRSFWVSQGKHIQKKQAEKIKASWEYLGIWRKGQVGDGSVYIAAKDDEVEMLMRRDLTLMLIRRLGVLRRKHIYIGWEEFRGI